MKKDRIVADGQQHIQKTEKYQRKAREIRREFQELAPDCALYLTCATHSSEELTEGKSKAQDW